MAQAVWCKLTSIKYYVPQCPLARLLATQSIRPGSWVVTSSARQGVSEASSPGLIRFLHGAHDTTHTLDPFSGSFTGMERGFRRIAKTPTDRFEDMLTDSIKTGLYICFYNSTSVQNNNQKFCNPMRVTEQTEWYSIVCQNHAS